jgi:uncharacterized membrane protein
MVKEWIEFHPLRTLNADGRLLFVTRALRLFAYGFLSVVLVLYLAQLGLGETQIGLLLTLTLMGDTFISLWITTRPTGWEGGGCFCSGLCSWWERVCCSP